MNRQNKIWLATAVLAVIFFSFQNFTKPIRFSLGSDNDFLSVEHNPLKETYRLVFPKSKAYVIMTKLSSSVDPILVEKPIYNNKGKVIKHQQITLYQGKQIACASIKGEEQNPFCWTMISKSGEFYLDLNFPSFDSKLFIKTSMPIQHIASENLQDYIANKDKMSNPLVIELKLSTSMAKSLNINNISPQMRCNSSENTSEKSCMFQISDEGEFFNDYVNI